MKTSPLQLDWVVYPKVSFEALQPEGEVAPPAEPVVEATVIYALNGSHTAMVTAKSGESLKDQGYGYHVEAVARFLLDIDIAREAYKSTSERALPGVVATNICRMVYAGVREFLATVTARGPWESLVLPSVIIEPSDVNIGSAEDRAEVLKVVFGIHLPTSEAEKSREPQRDTERNKGRESTG